MMTGDYKNSPELVVNRSKRCITHVKQRLSIDLDGQQETLSVVDFFIQDVLREEGRGTQLPVGDPRRTHMIHLMAPTIGAYFGEVLCRVFPCRWRLKSENPRDWLLEFDHVPLRFNPAGAAAEAIAEELIEIWSGSIATSPEEMQALGERLAAAPPVSENEFFALTTRFEVLQIAQEWLRARQEANDETPPPFLSPDDYDQIFEDEL